MVSSLMMRICATYGSAFLKCWPTVAAWRCIGRRKKLRTSGKSRSACGGNALIKGLLNFEEAAGGCDSLRLKQSVKLRRAGGGKSFQRGLKGMVIMTIPFVWQGSSCMVKMTTESTMHRSRAITVSKVTVFGFFTKPLFELWLNPLIFLQTSNLRAVNPLNNKQSSNLSTVNSLRSVAGGIVEITTLREERLGAGVYLVNSHRWWKLRFS